MIKSTKRILRLPLRARGYLYVGIMAGLSFCATLFVTDSLLLPSVITAGIAAGLAALPIIIRSPHVKHTEIVAGQARDIASRAQDEIGLSVYKIDDAFVAGLHGQAAPVLAEAFYGLKRSVAWPGMTRAWVAPRSYDQALLAHVLRADTTGSRLPVAAIIGSGGSGKSISLRKLALALQQAGGEVWWFGNARRLADAGLPAGCSSGAGTVKYILIDDVHELDNEAARTLVHDILDAPDLKVIVAGRRLPGALQHNNQLRIPVDAHPDLPAILHTIGRAIPAWSATAQEIEAKAQSAPRLIHVLLVLARYANTGHILPKHLDIHTLEKCFYEIIADDLKQIKTVSEGLFRATIDVARVKEWGLSVSMQTLAALVAPYQSAVQTQQLLASRDDDGWECTRPLLFFSKNDGVHFHHDELAHGVRTVAQDPTLLGEDVLATEKTAPFLLERIIAQGKPAEASQAFSVLIHRYPTLAGSEKAVVLLDELIAANNPHPEYQQVIYNETLPLSEDERISRIMTLSARNGIVGGAQWIRRIKGPAQKRARLLQKMYDAGYRDDLFIAEYLSYLGSKKGKQYAQALLAKQPRESLIVRAACVKLLKSAAKPAALQLAHDAHRDGKDLQAFKTAIRAMGRAGTAYADEALQDEKLPLIWREFCVNHGGVGAKAYATQVLQQKDADPGLLATCISKVGAGHKAQVAAVLQTNRHPAVVSVCLKVLGAAAKPQARLLLHERGLSDTIMIQCLNLLGPEAAYEAGQLLAQDALSADLRYTCMKLLNRDQARTFAAALLGRWQEEGDTRILVWSLRAAIGTHAAKAAAEHMSPHWHELAAPLKAAVLRADGDQARQHQRAQRILVTWQGQSRQLVSAAISVFNERPEASKDICQQILAAWPKEMPQSTSQTKLPYYGHILKALAHPQLRPVAKKTAEQMLLADNTQPGTLSLHMQTQIRNLVEKNVYPIWSGE